MSASTNKYNEGRDITVLAYGHEFIHDLDFWTSLYMSINEAEFSRLLETCMRDLEKELDSYVEKDDGSLPYYQILKELFEPVGIVIEALKTKDNENCREEVGGLTEVLKKYNNRLFDDGLRVRVRRRDEKGEKGEK
ncbi:hypothetical protein FKW77_003272 [Venturia effusa]|uniref:Uncharacterized protein n=1 Tax=Venturia effusa TaxID=50376 RepID=A0A517LMH6_9PEZI|nr:hypothetical protein FKW77_003272 [Venturia effusa]